MKKIISAIGAIALFGTISWTAIPTTASAEPVQPNVVIIITDDQPQGTLDVMPNLTGLLAKGVTFTNGIIPTSLCCPSRASLLTGQHSHTTKVYSLDGTYGGWKSFVPSESHTIATALDTAGYNTGLFGKYLNGWNGSTVPVGWDTFRAFAKPAYYNYTLAGTGAPQTYGSTATDYSTDVTANLASSFLAASDSPALVYYAPYGPHSPYTVAPRHKGLLPVAKASDIPGFNEADISDKPAWVQNRPLLDAQTQLVNFTKQRRTLLAVDEGIGKLIAAAGDEPTIYVFMSDNGYMNGSHRFKVKDLPYDRSTRVPMGIVYDGVVAPDTTNRITPNVDLTATLMQLTGLSLPNMDGRPIDQPRDSVVIEQMQRKTEDGVHPAYCGVRTNRYLYVQYDVGQGSELYDLQTDPQELENKVNDPNYNSVRTDLISQTKTLCNPVPPGFDW